MIEIYIEPTKMTKRGQLYQTRIGAPDGVVVLQNTHLPVVGTCRALVARGLSGPFRTHRSGLSYPCMTGDLERAATVTVEETRKISVRFRRYRPFNRSVH